MQTVGRSLAIAVMTLTVGAVVGIFAFRSAWLVFAPGFLTAWFGTGSESGGMGAFVGVNLAVWWAAWAAVLLVWQWFAARRNAA